MIVSNESQRIWKNVLNKITTFKKNPFHPLVWIVGKPKFGKKHWWHV